MQNGASPYNPLIPVLYHATVLLPYEHVLLSLILIIQWLMNELC